VAGKTKETFKLDKVHFEKMLGVVDEGVVWLRLQQSSGACIAPEDPDEG